MARASAGDVAAFGELVERYSDLANRVAGRLVGRDAAEDVAQDAFLRAFHRMTDLRDPATFKGWLLRIVHNAALDELQRRARRHRMEAADPGAEEHVAEPASGPPRACSRPASSAIGSRGSSACSATSTAWCSC